MELSLLLQLVNAFEWFIYSVVSSDRFCIMGILTALFSLCYLTHSDPAAKQIAPPFAICHAEVNGVIMKWRCMNKVYIDLNRFFFLFFKSRRGRVVKNRKSLGSTSHQHIHTQITMPPWCLAPYPHPSPDFLSFYSVTVSLTTPLA